MNIASQNQKIANYLSGGKRITPLAAFQKFSCMRLSARIYDLKKSGMKIKSKLITEGQKKYSTYFL